MARFELTAKTTLYVGGQVVPKGSQYIVNVNVPCVTENNIFTIPKSTESIRRQLAAQGLDLPPNMYLGRGFWTPEKI